MNDLRNSLILVNQGLTRMDGIDIHEQLTNLNLYSNKISRLTNLCSCSNLTNLDLSMNNIDRIAGLEALVKLEKLNLSHNKIEVVENISSLHSLIVCNLSFNKIINLNGFKQLIGPNYRLEILDVRGNLINSMEHLLSCLKPCRLLHHLMISVDKSKVKKSLLLYSTDEETILNNNDLMNLDNPICFISGFRYSIFNSLINLTSLDGIGRNGEIVDTKLIYSDPINESEISQVQFTTSESSDLDNFLLNVMSNNNVTKAQSVNSKIENVTQILQHPEISKMNSFSNGGLGSNILNQLVDSLGDKFLKILNTKLSENFTKNISNNELSSKIPVLKKLVSRNENVNKNLKHCNNRIKSGTSKRTRNIRRTQSRQSIEDSDELKNVWNENYNDDDDDDISHGHKSITNYKKNLMFVNSNKNQNCSNGTIKTVAANFSRLMENLNQEKELRWKSEQSVSELNRILREEKEERIGLLRKIDLMRKDSVNAGSNEMKVLVKDLEVEKDKNNIHQGKIHQMEKLSSDLHMKMADSELIINQIEEKLKKEEEACSTLRSKMMELERILEMKKHDHLVMSMTLKKELDIWKTKNENQKRKISELQTLLVLKDKELEGLASTNNQELEAYVQTRIDSAKNPLKLKITEFEKSYADLEDEFREALRSEFNRFEKIKEAFLYSEQTLKEFKKENEEIKEKEQQNLKVLSELNAIVKEQKRNLDELSRAKQTQISELKSRIKSLEKELRDLQSEADERVCMRQERSVLKSRIEALESLVVGLKSEKRIWGEELALQSSSLAQDKGRMESKIESLQLQSKNLEDQLAKASDQDKVNAKVISDLSNSVNKLKDMLLEKDELIKEKNKKLSEMEIQSERRIETINVEFAELVNQLEICSSRKDEVKAKLNATNERLEVKEEECKKIKDEWKRMNEEIKAVEKKVMKMADMKKENEQHLEEEKRSLASKHEQDVQCLQSEHTKQLVSMEAETQVLLKMADKRVKEVEEEMRDLLMQMEEERRCERLKMDTLKRAMQKFTSKIL